MFAPTNNPNDTGKETITNHPFFPDIKVADFRAATRAQDTVDDGRVVESLRGAMIAVNRELASWRDAQELAGYISIDEIPADEYGDITELVHHYLTAVYARTQAALTEYYHDASTTEEGLKRFIGFDGSHDTYLRDARIAIRNILGTPHMTVELI